MIVLPIAVRPECLAKVNVVFTAQHGHLVINVLRPFRSY